MDDERGTVVMRDAANGAEVKMLIEDSAESGGIRYLLVSAAGSHSEDEAEASILRELKESGDEIIYEQVTDADELRAAAALFRDPDCDYSIEF